MSVVSSTLFHWLNTKKGKVGRAGERGAKFVVITAEKPNRLEAGACVVNDVLETQQTEEDFCVNHSISLNFTV